MNCELIVQEHTASEAFGMIGGLLDLDAPYYRFHLVTYDGTPDFWEATLPVRFLPANWEAAQ